MGAIITIVALFDKTSVKKDVHRYRTIKTASGCHSGSNSPIPTPLTIEATIEEAPVAHYYPQCQHTIN